MLNTKIAEFASSLDPDETAHYWPLHLDLHCSLSSVRTLNMNSQIGFSIWAIFFLNFAEINIDVGFFGT